MQFRVSAELMLHKLQYHSAPTISTHLNDLLDNETVHASDIEYDYTFMVTTTYQRTPKSIVKTELNYDEYETAKNETSDELVDSDCFQGWPLSVLARPDSVMTDSIDEKPNLKVELHYDEETSVNHCDSGISLGEFPNSTKSSRPIREIKSTRAIRDSKPTLPIRPYSCVVCNRSFEKMNYLKAHISTHALNRPRYACHICGKSFMTKSYVKLHKKSFCAGFVAAYEGRNQPKAGIKKIHVKPYACEICGQKFRLKSHVM